MPNTRPITPENVSEFEWDDASPNSGDHTQSAQSNDQHSSTFDVLEFLSSKGVRVTKSEPHQGGMKHILEECIFDSTHKAPDAAVFVQADGKIGFKCFHNSCEGQDWKAVRNKLDPGRYERQRERQSSSSASTAKNNKIEYEHLTSAELADGNFCVEYHIHDVIAAGQPGIISGRFKTLKTSILIDAAVSMASATPFLGHFDVPRPINVAVMSGESGKGALQGTARRVCQARGIDLRDLDRLIWSTTLPKIGHPDHTTALRDFIEADNLQVLAIDPSYLAMSGIGDDAGNLFAVGRVLVTLTELGHETGCTILLCTHNKRAKSQDVPELGDVAWAGTSEWARQWILLNQRKPWDPDTGRHWLWMVAGGSEGHGCVVGLDVTEGRRSDHGGRRWEVDVVSAPEARERHRQAQRENKQYEVEADQAKQLEQDMKTVVELLRIRSGGETSKSIRELTGLSTRRCGPAIEALLRDKQIVDATITRTNGQSYAGFQLADE